MIVSVPGLPSLDESSLPLQRHRLGADKKTIVEQDEHNGRRVERVAFETDQLFIVGNVTLPPEGYQSRFSDSLNRTDLEFLSLTDCEITSLLDGRGRREDFLVLSKRHVRIAYPVDAPPFEGPGGIV